jgi:hypothetical protein
LSKRKFSNASLKSSLLAKSIDFHHTTSSLKPWGKKYFQSFHIDFFDAMNSSILGPSSFPIKKYSASHNPKIKN